MDAFRAGLLKKLDELHGGAKWHCLVWNGKSQYAHVKCIYKECVYQQWFTCDREGLPPRGIRYARSINQNHSCKAHETSDKRVRDNKFTY